MFFQAKSLGLLSRVPTVLVLGLSTLFFFVLFKPSAEPNIFIFSYFRATGLVFMVVLFLYSALSFRFPTLLSVNNHIFYTTVFGLIITEASLRAVPSLIPDKLVYLLPETDRKIVAAQRGLFTEQALSGEGMLFHWKPGLTLAGKPWVIIDSDGFRNRTVPKESTDVVILGASVPFAADVQFDLTDRFIQAGHTSYSLAMGSYAPQHYRDAYRRYVINRRIKHRAVIILINPKHDLDKSSHYQGIAEYGGGYKDFLRPAPVLNYNLFGIDNLWSLSILNGLPNRVIHQIRKALDSSAVNITLGWKKFSVKGSKFAPLFRPVGWAPYKRALTQIINDANASGAIPIVIHYPGAVARLLPYADLKKSIKNNLEQYVNAETLRIAQIVKNAGGRYLDVTKIFQLRSHAENLTVSPFDVHLNQAGIDLLYEAIREDVGKALKDNSSGV